LVFATIAVHLSGIYILIRQLYAIGPGDFTRRGVPFLLRVVMLLNLYIVALHMIEVCTWAAFYRAAAGFGDWATAVYFSLGCYSSVGGDRIVLPREWRLMERAEEISGTLMFGVSTGLIFGVTQEIHRRWRQSLQDRP